MYGVWDTGERENECIEYECMENGSIQYDNLTICCTHHMICIYCSKTKGFEKEQRLVYQIIEDAGNKGIWMRDIRGKSNIVQSELTRCLRTLESRKLIKSVRSVQAARRKVGYQEMGRLNDGQVVVKL